MVPLKTVRLKLMRGHVRTNRITVFQRAISVRKLTVSAFQRVILGLLCTIHLAAGAQSPRLGAGLSFGSPVAFNTGETGNPGFSLLYWQPIDRAEIFELVPSVTVYNPYKLETGYTSLYNYLLQGDVNLHAALMQTGSVRLVAFGGVNFTHLISNFTPLVDSGDETLEDMSDLAIGGNLGAGLDLYLSPQWDLNVSVKYIWSRYSQFVVSVQVAYHFKQRRKAYRR